ncbi:hypothetical protein [Xanthomonas translucens]|uniref:hypothetical protein n=1 Tax=Xanthomonas campestris pv. translucens TaxID=343 RepID=UPI000D22B401|nr:hypothetical protein [Xanthomonas translucens]AVY67205.1 hypothetical protein NZ30_13020 [Xanthomonas translucens pv. undulosa]
MSKYAELDAAIVLAINGGATKFSGLLHACNSHIEVIDSRGRAHTDERRLDARLQALRKAGRITFRKGHWSIA